MNWKKIKTFLIVLFLLINTYLVYSTNGFDFRKTDTSYTDRKTLADTVSIVKNNFNIDIKEDQIPETVSNLAIIDVSNIIYSQKFKDSEYDFKTKGARFDAVIKTDTYSYNESNANEQIVKILDNMGIDKESYSIDIKKSDEGLVCFVKGKISEYPIFNGEIKAVFAPSKISLGGMWYIAQSDAKKASPAKMTDITSVIIDFAPDAAKSDGSRVKVKNIGYGYYVSSYDENSVSKSSSAIPCYMLETDEGIKYYYDALNGKSLNQEE